MGFPPAQDYFFHEFLREIERYGKNRPIQVIPTQNFGENDPTTASRDTALVPLLMQSDGASETNHAQDYAHQFILFLQEQGYSALVVAPEAYAPPNGHYLVDLRIMQRRLEHQYPYTLHKLHDEIYKHRSGRIVRIIPSQQADLLETLLQEENIPYYMATPASERDQHTEYEINLLEMKIIPPRSS